MPSRVSSPNFVGRVDERRRLRAAFDAATAGNPSVILIGGEAGVGKTRLVGVAAEEVAARGGRAVTGVCLELVDRALPYGPVVQVLRNAQRTMTPADFDAVVGPARAELAYLLPELRSAADVAAAEPHDGGLLEHLLGVVERLGAQTPSLFVIEDLHWADRSTRDLLVFLARNLQATHVVVVGTYRSDDLHRRHPLRAVLAELERAGTVQRIDLERFTRDELRDQLAGILGAEPSETLVDAVFERSEGNAFFAEEVVAASPTGDCRSLPVTLRDLLLARVDELPESTRELLRTAAVIGRRFPHSLLAALCDRPDDDLLEDLRLAVEHQVLVTEGARYSFRHALVQEAVYDDLLPGERTGLHARLGALLVDSPELFDGGDVERISEVACHLFAAHDVARALPAAVDAARAAERMSAFPEALAHCERALELWDQVADAPETVHMSRVDLSHFAARMAELGGSPDRALALVRDALREVDPDADPVAAGLLHERLARFLWHMRAGDQGLIENETAVALVPADPPSEARARVVASLGQQLMVASRYVEAVAWCEQAIELAEALGTPVIEGHARNSLGTSLAHSGHVDEGLVELHRAAELARDTQSWSDLARAVGNESGVLESLGRFEESVILALAGADEAASHGLERSHGNFMRFCAIESLLELGRWSEAEELLQRVDRSRPVGGDEYRRLEDWAALHTARGDLDAAVACLTRIASQDRAPGQAPFGGQLRAAELALARRDYEQVTELTRETSGVYPGHRAQLLTVATTASAERADDARRRSDVSDTAAAVEDAQQYVDLLGDLQASDPDRSAESEIAGYLIAAHGELARANGTNDPEPWSVAARVWAAQGRRPRVAYARFREADALLRAGHGPTAAREPLREARTIAASLGARLLVEQIDALARRGRVSLGTDSSDDTPIDEPVDRLRLTDREREVLTLVAQGRTNRQVADALFISTKTASVHVSNILGKLDVTNRGEAAAVARRLGLDGLGPE
jgi:DNA-binding CsgD family transcriptional regulator/tetratricopeptide (TPR) repeat protein